MSRSTTDGTRRVFDGRAGRDGVEGGANASTVFFTAARRVRFIVSSRRLAVDAESRRRDDARVSFVGRGRGRVCVVVVVVVSFVVNVFFFFFLFFFFLFFFLFFFFFFFFFFFVVVVVVVVVVAVKVVAVNVSIT